MNDGLKACLVLALLAILFFTICFSWATQIALLCFIGAPWWLWTLAIIHLILTLVTITGNAVIQATKD